MPIKIDPEKCEGCGDCVEVCPSQAMQMVEEKAAVNHDECCECVACVDECRQDAIANAA